MILDHKNFRIFLASIDKDKTIEIFCSKDLNSILILSVLVEIFKKELLRFQIEFVNDNKLKIVIDDESHYFNDTDTVFCDCKFQIFNFLFNFIKSTNLIKTETLWPFLCFYAFNSFFGKNFFIDEFCLKCKDLHKDLCLAIKTMNCRQEGIFYLNKNKLEFLNSSNLSLALKNNLEHIFNKKLFSTGKATEKKINENLAKWGISIINSKNKFINLDLASKKLINETFGMEYKFIYKNGHDLEVSALEHAFIACYYIYKDKEMYSYLCFKKRKLIDVEKGCKFYYKVISMFKEGISNSFSSNKAILFKIKEHKGTPETNQSFYFELLNPLFKMYLSYREMKGKKILICFEGQSESILFSSDYDFKDFKEYENTDTQMRIPNKDLSQVFKNISNIK